MYTNVYEMRMPTHYIDMTAEEMEYDGGFFWVAPLATISAVCTIVSYSCIALKYFNIISAEDASLVGGVASAIGAVTGVASGIGGLWSSTASTAAKKLAGYTSSLTLEPGMSVATCKL